MKKLTNKASFFIMLLERYADNKQKTAIEILNLWKSEGIIDYINNMYEQYHSERIENAFSDIDKKLCRHNT